MSLARMVDQPTAWLPTGDDSAIVVSSRIRLARNLEGAAFPGWAGETECASLQKRLLAALSATTALGNAPMIFDMHTLTAVERDVLRERHLISLDLAHKGLGSGLVVRTDESLSVMINEEDHLRLQAMRSGFTLDELWNEINALDDQIEDQLSYAFSHTLGYLTACPSNVGTGLRASVMLHIPALRLMDETEPVLKGLAAMDIAVRGLCGEGTEAAGNMFQISNQTTLGASENDLIHRLQAIVTEVSNHETNARQRLIEERPVRLRDAVGRAYGIVRHAGVLSSNEALDHLSTLHLGATLGILNKADISALNRLLLWTQPGHLQWQLGRSVPPGERDELRARMVAEALRSARLV
ncbi:MAG: protein arginine kinase [bacterium]